MGHTKNRNLYLCHTVWSNLGSFCFIHCNGSLKVKTQILRSILIIHSFVPLPRILLLMISSLRIKSLKIFNIGKNYKEGHVKFPNKFLLRINYIGKSHSLSLRALASQSLLSRRRNFVLLSKQLRRSTYSDENTSCCKLACRVSQIPWDDPQAAIFFWLWAEHQKILLKWLKGRGGWQVQCTAQQFSMLLRNTAI